MIALVALVTTVVLFATDAQDPIPNTQLDNWLLAVAAIAVALVALAAASHKTPIRQVGQGIGWVLRRLVGEPFGAWLVGLFTVHARVIVREELEPAVRTAVSEALVAQDPERAELHRQVADLVAWQPTVDEALRELRDTVPHVPTSEPPTR